MVECQSQADVFQAVATTVFRFRDFPPYRCQQILQLDCVRVVDLGGDLLGLVPIGSIEQHRLAPAVEAQPALGAADPVSFGRYPHGRSCARRHQGAGLETHDALHHLW